MRDETFTSRLLSLAAKEGMTIRALARVSGVSANTIGNYINGHSAPTLPRLRKLKDALDCTWDELLG